MTVPSRQRGLLAALIFLILAGFALRIYQLNTVALRGDEIFTIRYWMRQPLAVTLDTIATSDPQPPLAYGIYRLWALLVGDQAELARFLPTLLNTLGIPALYALGKRLGGWRMGLVAALLWTLHPFHIWHAQDARNYAIWGAMSAITLWLALRAIEERRPIDWLLYVVSAALTAYLYYLELFVIFVVNLYVLIVYWRDRRFLIRWLLSQVAIALLLAPWFLQDRLLRGSGYGGTTGGFDVQQLWSRFLPVLNFGQTLDATVFAWLWPLLLIALAVAAALLWRFRWQIALFPTLLGVIPPLLLGIVSTRLNVFTPRYVLGAAPAYTLLVAGLFIPGVVRSTAVRRSLQAVLLAFWIGVSGYALYNHYFVPDYTKSPDWPALLRYLEQQVTEGDIIVQAAADEAFNFYFDDYAIHADRKQLPANPNQSVEEITELLSADAITHTSFWRVAQTFPDWPNAGVVENWLDENLQQVRTGTISGIRVQQYMAWDVSEIDTSTEPIAVFEGTAELVAASVHAPIEAGQPATIWLYWRPSAQTEQPLKVFVHLIGSPNPATGSPLWSQDDRFPQNERISTTTWATGTLYRDVHPLPLADVPPGEYTVTVGFYNPETLERIRVGDTDHAEIGRLTVP